MIEILMAAQRRNQACALVCTLHMSHLVLGPPKAQMSFISVRHGQIQEKFLFLFLILVRFGMISFTIYKT